MKKTSPIFSFILPLIFLFVGFTLISKENQFSIVVGYINIVFWLGLLLFNLYKLITKKKI